MVNGIIGRKVGMTQVFEDSGKAVPCYRYPSRSMPDCPT